MPRISKRRRQEQLDTLAGRLTLLATDHVGRRQSLETRWIDDFRQLEGRYDPETEQNLEDLDQSQAFANLTRPKADAAIARLEEILFPQDEDTFSVDPTPSPILMDMQGSQQPFSGGNVIDPNTGQPVTEDQAAQRIKIEAKKRSRKMKEIIKDQLEESDWPSVARKVITSGVEYGTGVLKGPVVQGKLRTSWVPEQSEGGIVHSISEVEDFGVGVEYVNLWDFFPDMSAASMDEADFVFVRHVLNKRSMRKLAKQPGFDADVIREVMTGGSPSIDSSTAWGELREVTGVEDQGRGDAWEVWEYHGEIDDDMLEAAGFKDASSPNDPLRAVLAEVWFCNNRTLRVNLNPLEPQELPFSVFNYDSDPTSIFGRGIPYRIRHSQSSGNSAWRMMHDNGALAAGGQIIMDSTVTKASKYGGNANDRKLEHRGVWLKDDPTIPIENVFGQYTFDGQLQSLQLLYQMSRQLIDEESGFPAIVQGDAQTNLSTNATGLTVLSNLALTLMKRPVGNFDNEVIRPLVTRFYNWNMAHAPDPLIKGDYEVAVRGSKYLVTKEVRAQNAVWLAQQALTNPLLTQYADPRRAFRALVHAAQHEPAEWMVPEALTEDELSAPGNPEADMAAQQAQAEQQAQQAQQQLEQAKLQVEQAKLELQQMEIQQREIESQREFELKVAQLAIEQETSFEEIRNKLAVEAMKDSTKNREITFKERTGRQGI